MDRREAHIFRFGDSFSLPFFEFRGTMVEASSFDADTRTAPSNSGEISLAKRFRGLRSSSLFLLLGADLVAGRNSSSLSCLRSFLELPSDFLVRKVADFFRAPPTLVLPSCHSAYIFCAHQL